MPNTQFSNIQKQKVSFVVRGPDNRVKPLDGVPVWESTDELIVRVEAAPDGMSATLVSSGQAGSAQIAVRVDVDPGTGTIEQIGVIDVTVTESGEVNFEFTFDPAERR